MVRWTATQRAYRLPLKTHKTRFLIFTNIDWKGMGKAETPFNLGLQPTGICKEDRARLEEAKTLGVSGLKVFKSLGLELRNADGSFTQIDVERFDPIWEACG